MNQNQLNKILEQQRWLKNNAEVELYCNMYKISEYEFYRKFIWQWALRQKVIDRIPVDIIDIDLSKDIAFTE